MAQPEATELLTVLIPCLNEEDAIDGTVEGVLSVVERLPVEVEILLIDDGSTDGTGLRMEEICAREPRCRMHVNPQNLGLGRSVRGAYESIRPDSWITVVPGDNEIIFDSIEAYMAVRDRYDVILGYLQNPVIRPMRRRLASQLFTFVTQVLYGFNYQYLNGMKMYRAWAFQGIEITSGGHAFVAELLAKAILRSPRLRIGEVPFAARGRSSGSSRAVRPLSVLRAVRDVWAGKLSVNAYRKQVISGGGILPQPDPDGPGEDQ
ncbi:glycosyltransferase family 2 protein [Gemmatimonadota bacterium]